jgi:iron complex outermembrane receptor protein
MDIQNAQGSSWSTDKRQASINIQNRFNKTFEHTLNYNNDLSDNFNLDALVGYSYYDYTADGSFSSGKGYDSAQTNLIDNIEGGLQNEFRVSSFRNRTELQSYFGRVNATLFNKLIITGTTLMVLRSWEKITNTIISHQ